MREKTEKKKRPKFDRLIGWLLFIIVFSIFIYYQLPLKAVFIIILFGVGLLIPKRYEKRVNVFGWIILLLIIAWVLLPEKEQEWRPYIFYDELVTFEKQRQISDEENAAKVYQQLIDQFDQDEYESFWNVHRGTHRFEKPWTREQYPEVYQWIQKNQFVIDGVKQAVKYEKCVFPLVPGILDPGFEIPQNGEDLFEYWYGDDTYISLTRFEKIIRYSVYNDIAEGRALKALEKHLLILALAEHLQQQYKMDYKIRGLILHCHAYNNINRRFIETKAAAKEIEVVQEALSNIEYDWKKEISQVLQHHSFLLKDVACSNIYQINQGGDVRINFDPKGIWFEFTKMVPPDDPAGISEIKSDFGKYLLKKFHKFTRLPLWFLLPSKPQHAEKIIEDFTLQYHVMYDPEDGLKYIEDMYPVSMKINFKTYVKCMSIMTGPNYESFYDLFLKANMYKQATQIIIGLKRHKNETSHWPESLDVIARQLPDGVLIDPMNGGAFVYRVEGDSFVFYSRGKNGEDEYGQLLRWYANDPNVVDFSLRRPDDIAIWPYIEK